MEERSPVRQFAAYVSQNILGSLGISAYILADTYFISRTAGPSGITALNLTLPVYSLIFAIGSMIGVGGATRFRISSAGNGREKDRFFFQAVLFCCLFGALFMLVGLMCPGGLLRLMGADEEILKVGTSYTRIFLLFAPFFMLNFVANAFTRNDNAPTVAMAATFSSSIFNIIMDYILIFPAGLGMTGAALATAFSPLVGISICCIHIFSKKSTLKLLPAPPSPRVLARSCQLGISAFIGEIAGGVTTLVFNLLLLDIAGNLGVAAYGILANVSIVVIAIFNGIVQGAQPLLSFYYGAGRKKELRTIRSMSFGLALICGVLLAASGICFADPIIRIFNHAGDETMAAYARNGFHIYFLGYLFAGLNMVGAGSFSAMARAGRAFAVSILRGFVAIIIAALLLAEFFGMNGVWAAFPAAEAVTLLVLLALTLIKEKP